MYVPYERKTIKPYKDAGGVIGGEKYIVQNILFKFAVGKPGMYDEDAAAKVTPLLRFSSNSLLFFSFTFPIQYAQRWRRLLLFLPSLVNRLRHHSPRKEMFSSFPSAMSLIMLTQPIHLHHIIDLTYPRSRDMSSRASFISGIVAFKISTSLCNGTLSFLPAAFPHLGLLLILPVAIVLR